MFTLRKVRGFSLVLFAIRVCSYTTFGCNFFNWSFSIWFASLFRIFPLCFQTFHQFSLMRSTNYQLKNIPQNNCIIEIHHKYSVRKILMLNRFATQWAKAFYKLVPKIYINCLRTGVICISSIHFPHSHRTNAIYKIITDFCVFIQWMAQIWIIWFIEFLIKFIR